MTQTSQVTIAEEPRSFYECQEALQALSFLLAKTQPGSDKPKPNPLPQWIREDGSITAAFRRAERLIKQFYADYQAPALERFELSTIALLDSLAADDSQPQVVIAITKRTLNDYFSKIIGSREFEGQGTVEKVIRDAFPKNPTQDNLLASLRDDMLVFARWINAEQSRLLEVDQAIDKAWQKLHQIQWQKPHQMVRNITNALQALLVKDAGVVLFELNDALTQMHALLILFFIEASRFSTLKELEDAPQSGNTDNKRMFVDLVDILRNGVYTTFDKLMDPMKHLSKNTVCIRFVPNDPFNPIEIVTTGSNVRELAPLLRSSFKRLRQRKIPVDQANAFLAILEPHKTQNRRFDPVAASSAKLIEIAEEIVTHPERFQLDTRTKRVIDWIRIQRGLA